MPGFVLDTNVVSEIVRADPAPAVLQWVASQPAAELFLSAVTIGELVRGVSRLPLGRRRSGLKRWIEEDLRKHFEGRVLPFDEAAAVLWGNLLADMDRVGRPRPVIDAQIAATAIRFGVELVTRNTADFADFPVKIFNPWQGA